MASVTKPVSVSMPSEPSAASTRYPTGSTASCEVENERTVQPANSSVSPAVKATTGQVRIWDTPRVT